MWNTAVVLDSYKYKNLNIETIVVKKYPNRRLYNTKTSAYITLEELASLIKNDYNVLVVDSQTWYPTHLHLLLSGIKA